MLENYSHVTKSCNIMSVIKMPTQVTYPNYLYFVIIFNEQVAQAGGSPDGIHGCASNTEFVCGHI